MGPMLWLCRWRGKGTEAVILAGLRVECLYELSTLCNKLPLHSQVYNIYYLVVSICPESGCGLARFSVIKVLGLQNFQDSTGKVSPPKLTHEALGKIQFSWAVGQWPPSVSCHMDFSIGQLTGMVSEPARERQH